ncbi:hypothetical protein HK096_008942, partial [Nowakowskiella sp. JEL0078]
MSSRQAARTETSTPTSRRTTTVVLSTSAANHVSESPLLSSASAAATSSLPFGLSPTTLYAIAAAAACVLIAIAFVWWRRASKAKGEEKAMELEAAKPVGTSKRSTEKDGAFRGESHASLVTSKQPQKIHPPSIRPADNIPGVAPLNYPQVNDRPLYVSKKESVKPSVNAEKSPKVGHLNIVADVAVRNSTNNKFTDKNRIIIANVDKKNEKLIIESEPEDFVNIKNDDRRLDYKDQNDLKENREDVKVGKSIHSFQQSEDKGKKIQSNKFESNADFQPPSSNLDLLAENRKSKISERLQQPDKILSDYSQPP